MNRAIPLIVAIVAFGGGLAFLALETSPQGPAPELRTSIESPSSLESTARPKAASTDGSQGTELATIQDIDRSAPAVGGTSRYWEVIPMNAQGQRIDSATVSATPRGDLEGSANPMEASGRTKWDAVPAGIWTLTVEVEGKPTWTRDVLVRAGKPVRTPVYLGDELRISGEVRDSNGAPLPRNTPIFFLPKGAEHPAQEDLQRNARAGNETAPDGAIAVQTNAAGRFKTRLPRAGEYRISVGTPRGGDAARWTQPKGHTLTHGGPDHVIATVPARAELMVRLTGPKEERATAMSAYIFDAERAAQMRSQGQGRGLGRSGARDDRSAGTLEEAQRAAKEAALAEGLGSGKRGQPGGGSRTGTARTMSEENAKMQNADFEAMGDSARAGAGAAQAPLFEMGWRSVGSRTIDADGEVVFNDLPAGKDLRFLFVRGSERIATLAPIRMRKEQRAMGTVVLPPLILEPGFHQNSLATLRVEDRPEDPETPRLEVGVQWTIAGR